MPSVYQAVLRSWAIPPATTFAIALSALVYLRGWWLLRRAGSPSLPPWRALTFLLGLFSLWVALASPMDVFNGFVLTAHMLQHMVLMMVAPPLILLGAPLIPMVRGLPIFAAREFAGPFLNWSVAKRVGGVLTNPVVALLLMGIAMFAWHTPALYELALRSSSWHQVEHACFFLTSIIFWWPVVQPWPSRAQWPRWAMVPYLLIADLQNTALSAILAFSDRVLYPSYAAVPRLFGLSALEDQVAAGAIMWVVGSLAFLVPAVIIAVQCLSRKSSPEARASIRRPEAAVPDTSGSLPAFFSSSGRKRWRSHGVEATAFIVLFALAGVCFAKLAATANHDDEQVLRFQGASGALAVAVFAPPDLAAGSSSFSVLVQDGSSRVVLDAAVDLTATPAAQGAPVTTRASHQDAENKLLQAAEMSLPAEGDWTLTVAVREHAEVSDFWLPLHVVKAEPGFELPWSYLLVLVVAVVLALAYSVRHWPRTRRPVEQSSPVGSSRV